MITYFYAIKNNSTHETYRIFQMENNAQKYCDKLNTFQLDKFSVRLMKKSDVEYSSIFEKTKPQNVII